ncbi:MAG: L,D-transpeptidase [Candidatus Niameybacter stercoravium]|nr:L,D-transpeptidase [Candidatus Niameybacter stercoravium]
MKKLLTILFLFCLIAVPITATEPTSSHYLGQLEASNITLDFNDIHIETYDVLGSKYVPLFRLREIGLNVHYDPQTGIIKVAYNETPTTKATLSDVSLVHQYYSLYEHDIWINNFKTHGIDSQDNVLIPIGALRELYHIEINGTSYKMIPKEPLHISATLDQITNDLPTPVTLSVVDLYWDNGFTYQPSHYDLKPLETITRSANTLHASKKYLSTIITKAEGYELNYTNENMFGQINTRLFERYSLAQNTDYLASLGDPIDIGTLIWAEDTINQSGLSSKTPYLIWTNTARQRTYIFEGSKGNWKLIKHFLCSTGKSHSPTPKGTFELTYKVPYFGVEKGYRCKNAFGFIGTTYLYHSVMFDKSGTYLLKGKGELGTPASAGCIRLSVENSEWLYNNMISRTRVFID